MTETITKYKFPQGAIVKGQDGAEFFLLAAEAEEWEARVNDKSITDAQFWAWWDEFRARKHIFPRLSKWSTPKKSDGLSSWWQYDLHKAFEGSSDSSVKLALALGSVANTVRIIDDSTPPYIVSWAARGAPTSSTDIDGKTIWINSKPIKKPGTMTPGQAIDVTTGFGLHEASHAKYTGQIHDQLRIPDGVKPLEVTMFLANVIEDLRIEALTSQEYPGFKPYFDAAANYMWGEILEQLQKHTATKVGQPKTWGECDLRNCLNAIVMWVKWPTKAPEVLPDASYMEEMPWWLDWSKRYQAGAISIREAVIEGRDRLMKANPEVEKDILAKMAGEGGTILEKLLPTCINDKHDIEGMITEKEAQRVNDLVREQLREWKPTNYPSVPQRKVLVRRPVLPGGTEPIKAKGLVDRLKAVLRFRPELPRYSERLLKHGVLDEDQLFRFAMDDNRMFERHVIETYPNAQVSLLVDMSGSMMSGTGRGGKELMNGFNVDYGYHGTRVGLAMALAHLFTSALATIEGVKPKVFGHTADVSGSHTCEVYELWEPGDDQRRLRLITALPHSNNLDGYAIEYCVDELANRGEPSDKRLLIVLADGQPSADGYSGSTAVQHVRSVTDAAEKKGVFVLQIGLADDLRHEDQKRMFKHWLPFTSYDELPRQLTRALSNLLNA